MVALVAVVAAEHADFLIGEAEAQRREDAAGLGPRHVATLGGVEVLEVGRDEHALLPHDRADLVLDGGDEVRLVGAQRHPVSPGGRGRRRVRHGDAHHRGPLQTRHREGRVDVLDKGLVLEHAVIPGVLCHERLEVALVDVLAKVHDREDGLHLSHSADALAQSVEVLEVLLQAATLLDDPGLNLVDHIQLGVAPVRVVRLQVEGAGGEGRRRSGHHLRDVVVHGDEVDVTLVLVISHGNIVPLAQELDLLLFHLLLEGEGPQELHLRALASPARILPGRRCCVRVAVSIHVDVLDRDAARLAEGGEAMEGVGELCLLLLVLKGLRPEGHRHRVAGRREPGGQHARGGRRRVEDLVDVLAERLVVEDLGLLHVRARLHVVVDDRLLLLLREPGGAQLVADPREGGDVAAAVSERIGVLEHLQHADAAREHVRLNLRDDTLNELLLVPLLKHHGRFSVPHRSGGGWNCARRKQL
mmetsp:Transcript_33834/g.89694  ORF Transcript_33834/g.89694 Transcript_33834/m.89694 type:complete len:473 (-) Transcript_33834:37-1455(-)